jgi:hypothetical protein
MEGRTEYSGEGYYAICQGTMATKDGQPTVPTWGCPLHGTRTQE